MDNMDKLNGGYWETRGERRSRKRTNFFIEETKSPPKSSKKRTIEGKNNIQSARDAAKVKSIVKYLTVQFQLSKINYGVISSCTL